MSVVISSFNWSAPPMWLCGSLNKHDKVSGCPTIKLQIWRLVPNLAVTSLCKCWLHNLTRQSACPDQKHPVLGCSKKQKKDNKSHSPFQEMVGDGLATLSTPSACRCDFKDRPSSCHVSRKWDPHCPEGLEWRLWSGRDPVCWCALLRLRQNWDTAAFLKEDLKVSADFECFSLSLF